MLRAMVADRGRESESSTQTTAPAGRNELAQGGSPGDSIATKIRSPVGRDTGLFGTLGTRGSNAQAWLPGGIEFCLPRHRREVCRPAGAGALCSIVFPGLPPLG